MSAEPRTVSFDLSAEGIKNPTARTLLAAPLSKEDSVPLKAVVIPAFGVFIAAVN